MKRSLPSTSTNKRKQQDAFGNASSFTPSKARGVDESAGAANSGRKGAIIKNDALVPATSLPRGVPLRQSEVSKPQSIMTFSPMARLDKSHGRNNGLPETPSKTYRLASPGLPAPMGFTLPTAPGTSLQTRASRPTDTRGISTSKISAGMSPLQSVMTPLSGLKAIGGVSRTDAQSPSANLSKIRSMQTINSSASLGNKPPILHDASRENGLPPMPNFRALAESDNDRSSSVEPDSAVFSEVFSPQDTSRIKARQNDDRNSLTRYLNRLVSKQQAASSLFLANLSLSSSNQSSRSRVTNADTRNASEPIVTSGPASVFSTADIVVVVQFPLLPVQHASPIFQCRVVNTGRNRSLGFHSINPSDSLLVSFSGNTSLQAGPKELRGHIDPNRLAATMKQIQMHQDRGHVPKEIMAGMWEPCQEVSLGVKDGADIPRVVLLCSRFVIMEA